MFRWLLFLTLGLRALSAHPEPPPSLHVLIATVGNPTLFTMLDSLCQQLEAEDFLTVVYDAKDLGRTFESLFPVLQKFKCHCSVIVEPENLGFWGHGIRNKHNVLEGDFVLHADDDDIYLPGAFDMIRSVCTDKSTLYIFRAIVPDIEKPEGILITGRPFQQGHINTAMGVIPKEYNSQSVWAYRYGGDFDFYNKLIRLVPKLKLVRHTIYKHRPN